MKDYGEDIGGFADGDYEHGDVRVAVPRCADPATCDHDHQFYYAEKPVVYLPHQCGEWTIGGVEEVRAMIADLEFALVELSKTEK
jgi:hypothetical protein